MRKRFNTTGTCYPEMHYLMDNRGKLKEIMKLIERGKYFTINRPQQFGKTTTMYFLGGILREKDNYLPIELNFQGIGEIWHESNKAFTQMFFNQLANFFEFQQPHLLPFFDKERDLVIDMGSLSKFVTQLVKKLNKKIVLIIDEVDAFRSIVLVGVHDIKTLKYKMRPTDNAQYNSPWNIATDFKVRMSFNPKEIAPMLEAYSQAEGVKMDIPVLSERLYYYTSGYPFLVSKLCKIIAEDIFPKKTEKTWTLADLEQAVLLILKENNTNFDSLIKNLELYPDLYNLVKRVIIDGERIAFNPDEPIINLGRMYGVFKSNGHLKIHNRIYEQRIYNYLAAKAMVKMPTRGNFAMHFLLDNNALDMQGVLLKFQQFMKEQYSDKDKDFYEREGRIIFLAFLTPILNGQGYTFKEVQISLEKRLDVIVTYFQHRYIIELKLWYGEEYHQKGLTQLSDYLETHGVEEGFLVIFDDRKKKSWKNEKVQHNGKEILAVWV